MRKFSNIRKNILNSQRASITTLTLITIFTFITVLTGTFITIMALRQSQYDSDIRIQQVYGVDVNNVDEIYAELEEILTGGSWNNKKSVNKPELLKGMTPIKFTTPENDQTGKIITTTKEDENWYEYGTTYETKRWANAKTEDGSMWVWIPRFAYRIDAENQKVDVVFLIGNTDKYYDSDGKLQTAKRCETQLQDVNTNTGYTVHPAFTNERSIGYRNGGWDKEITGIWVAKFEAGYASGNNSAPVKESNVNYTQTTSYVYSTERGESSNGAETARNWLDGIYGETETSIKYPTFQGTTYSMNYINQNDSYNISKSLTDTGNIYGLDNNYTDSHLMKNSEWGACAYLSASKYGLNGTKMTTNNINLNSNGRKREETVGKSGVDSVYAVTGCSSNNIDKGDVRTTIEALNALTTNTGVESTNKSGVMVYVWNQINGIKSSTTGTIYGIYDMSGGLWERTSSYIANGNNNLKTYGKSMTYEGENLKTISNKYTTVYPSNEVGETNIDNASQKNYRSNTKIYGDSIRETCSNNAGTSNSGWNASSWKDEYSTFFGMGNPFLVRGANLWNGIRAGTYAFSRVDGNCIYHSGFRAVLIAK